MWHAMKAKLWLHCSRSFGFYYQPAFFWINNTNKKLWGKLSLFSVLFFEFFTWFSNYFHLCSNNIIFWCGFYLVWFVCKCLWNTYRRGFGRTILWLTFVIQTGLKAPAKCSTPAIKSAISFLPFLSRDMNLIDGLLCLKDLLLVATIMIIYTENCARFNTFTGLSIVKHSKVLRISLAEMRQKIERKRKKKQIWDWWIFAVVHSFLIV